MFNTCELPLTEREKRSLHDIIAELAKASLRTVDLSEKFVLETDASDVAISAVLSQNDAPIAYFSRTLNASERQ